MRYALPQPFEEIDHTADVGLRVRGADAEECLARLALAMSHLLTGGGPTSASTEQTIEVAADEPTFMAIDLLRELLFRFDCERLVAVALEVERFDREGGLVVRAQMAPWDEVAHEEGVELKAVTLHEARFAAEGEGYAAQIVFDV